MTGEAPPTVPEVAPPLRVGAGTGGDVDLDASELVTGRTAVLGQSGSGKSYLTAVLCEELAAAGLPFFVVDPEGEYATLKEGHEVLHVAPEGGDVALDDASPAKVAKATLVGGVSVVLDVSQGNHEKAEPFLRALFEASDEAGARPCLVVVEEASLFAPQGPGSSRALLDLARRGRKRGLGLLVATQRPALVDKNVLSQCNSFLAGKLALPHDLKALRQMVPAAVLNDVPKLGRGEFFLVGALAGDRGLLRFKARRRRTTHRAATPAARGGPSRALAEVIASVLAAEAAQPADRGERAVPPQPRTGGTARPAAPRPTSGKIVANRLVPRYDAEQAKAVAARGLRRRWWLFGRPVERVVQTKARWVQVHVVTLGYEEGRVARRLAHRFAVVVPQRSALLLRDHRATWSYAPFGGLARGHLLALEALGRGRWDRVPWFRPRLSAEALAARMGMSKGYATKVARDLVAWGFAQPAPGEGERVRMARGRRVPTRRRRFAETRPSTQRGDVEGRLEPCDEGLPAEVVQLLAGVRGTVLEDRRAWLPLYDFVVEDERGRERAVTFDAVTGRAWRTRFL